MNNKMDPIPMKYRVIFIESEEGFSISCPALKGCHSQGETREEALENIKDAIRGWLEVEEEDRTHRRDIIE